MNNQQKFGSYRDPSGFVFSTNGTIYRQINRQYEPHYTKLMESGLYQRLVEEGLLIPHRTSDPGLARTDDAYQVIEPDLVPFISYPYEWSFRQLKMAALVTLRIQEIAFEYGMVLKDANAYNIQFLGSQPVLIDTLSFELYPEKAPWVAYRQFCEQFLNPLVLTAKVHPDLLQLIKANVDGIPLELTARLLPWGQKIRPSLLTHVVLHARAQQKFSAETETPATAKAGVSELGFRGLIDNLKNTVQGVEWRYPASEWGEYYASTNYDDDAMQQKASLVEKLLVSLHGEVERVVDFGANTGFFSSIAQKFARTVISIDVDPVAVDKHFLQRVEESNDRVLPLLGNLVSPSPAVGWANEERASLLERARGDVLMALALIHHIAISNNVPLQSIAQVFAGLAPVLIIEFVPKSDSQVERLLATREDIFPEYNREGFEAAFGQFFIIRERIDIDGTARTLYLMERR